jgi:cobalt/nickel transport system permease protein
MMHIPDGYLSPSTCATLYVAAAPFWSVALKKVQRYLNTRVIPLISVFAAFSFVIMMFNLPLPGGTTGHAVGMGIATIVLGPWGSILAVSVALLIQALFFGDGGITAFGANAFNMAIVGSLVSYGVYRLLAGDVLLTSPRRVVAGAIAGYAGINAAALCAAIQFGIQLMLFHDAGGAPLYAPYPLHIAVPAMMIGHLTFAGLAELVITGGVVAYLQRADSSLLKRTAPNVAGTEDAVQEVATRSGWRVSRALWAGLAVLMLVTPLGLLAAGTAWGEWSPEDFADPAAHAAITTASGATAPTTAPVGLERLSTLWSAPFSGYEPSFMQNANFGYILSAIMGAGLIILAFLLITWLFSLRGSQSASSSKPS